MATPPMNAPTGQQWSEWSLHPNQQYYYRGRHVSYLYFTSVGDNERNKIIPDGQGRYTHYQFMSLQEFAAASAAAAQQSRLPAPPNPETEDEEEEEEDSEEGSSRSSRASRNTNKHSPRVVMKLKGTANGVEITVPKSNKEHTIVLDKKALNKLQLEKKKVNSRVKVTRWFEEY